MVLFRKRVLRLSLGYVDMLAELPAVLHPICTVLPAV